MSVPSFHTYLVNQINVKVEYIFAQLLTLPKLICSFVIETLYAIYIYILKTKETHSN